MKGTGKMTECKRLPRHAKDDIHDSLTDLEVARTKITEVQGKTADPDSIRILSSVKDLLWLIQLRLTGIKPREEAEK